MHNLIIVGGGPAALGAAVYALDRHLDMLLIAEDVGVKSGLPHHTDGARPEGAQVSAAAAQLFEVAMSGHQQLILRDRVVDVTVADGHFQVATQRHGVQTSMTVIIATGVTPLTLDVPGARQWIGYGLGYSPTTYAPLLAGKTVAVIGNTPRTLRGASELARTAAQVYLILPDVTDGASPLSLQLRQRSNVSILSGYRVTELIGHDQIEQIAIVRDDEQAFVPADAVFADLGLLPHSEMVHRLAVVDPDGFIIVDNQYATSVPGLFAAGDVSTTFSEQVVIALGAGTRAARSAYDYLLAQPNIPNTTLQAEPPRA